MSAKAEVGRSSRTPVKHYLLDKSLGKICGVLSLGSPKVPCKASHTQPLICVDLCGGDGTQTDEHEASPVIMAKHCFALGAKGKPATLDIIEKSANTYEQLVANCGHYSRDVVTLTNGDAREYQLPNLKETQPAFIHCDPNTVDQTPLSRPFVAGFNRYTTYLVTLGCNVGGAKRTDADKRSLWFEYVQMLIEVLPQHHDAILFWLNRDESQWAYLLSMPKVWAGEFASKAVRDTGKIWVKGVSSVSYADQRRQFHDQLSRLFLTKEEYASR
jgi:hypothetical protein